MKRSICLTLSTLCAAALLTGCSGKSDSSADEEPEHFSAYGLTSAHICTLTAADLDAARIPEGAVCKFTNTSNTGISVEYQNEYGDPLLSYQLNDDGNPDEVSRYLYEYNDKGQITWSLRYWEGLLGYKTDEYYFEYGCDATHEPTLTVNYENGQLGFAMQFDYDKLGEYLGDYSVYYDAEAAENGKRKIRAVSDRRYYDCQYDADGHLISYTLHDDDGKLESTTVCEYDAAGNCIRTERIWEKRQDTSYLNYKRVNVYTYDSAGHKICNEQTTWKDPDSDGTDYKAEQEYDSEGRQTRVKYTYASGLTEIAENTYEPL